jgi:excisionase family DNA binding protein
VERLLTVEDLAALLRKRPAAVRLLARGGAIAFHRVGRSLRFDPADVEAFLARQRRPARGEKAVASRP